MSDEATIIEPEESAQLVKRPAEGSEIIRKAIAFNNGGYFEYKVVPIIDKMAGDANVAKIEELLNIYGELGWRLCQTMVNQVGMSMVSNPEAGTTGNIQEQTLLVFERWRQA